MPLCVQGGAGVTALPPETAPCSLEKTTMEEQDTVSDGWAGGPAGWVPEKSWLVASPQAKLSASTRGPAAQTLTTDAQLLCRAGAR